MKHLVIGLGEVGKAIKEILECDGIDYGDKIDQTFDFIHICFPYSSEFINNVINYQDIYKPKYTVVHSSVPVGTCRKIPRTVHSPIRGVHPNLVNGICTFEKYFGGELSFPASKPFSDIGIKTVVVNNSDDTEALKLWDTTQYGISIMIQKDIKKFCDDYGLDFNLVYTHANNSYNDGYSQLGMSNVIRPVLKNMEGPIGGHCVIQNCSLLSGSTADKWTTRLISDNEQYK